MIKNAKWKQKLTIKQIGHIRETTNSGTLAQFKRNRDANRIKEIICNECKTIAQRLGID